MMDRLRPGRLTAAAVAVSLVAWACSSPATGTAVPSISPTIAATPTTAAAPTAAATITPIVATPSPVALDALDLAWTGSGPTEPGACCQTWWPAIDPKTGQIWVADSFANVYWIFDPDGTFKESWGKPGTGKGQFDFSAHRPNPQAVGAIAFAPDGSFFVADNGNRRIQHFDPNRKYIGEWGAFGTDNGQFASPFGIATDGKTVYVADDDRGDVQAFTTDGTYLRTLGEIVTDAGIFIAVDPAGDLYRSDGPARVISKYGPDGTPLGTFDVGIADGLVAGLAVDKAGDIYANTYGTVPQLVELGPSGSRLAAWSTSDETLAVDPEGTIVYQAGPDSPASLRAYALP